MQTYTTQVHAKQQNISRTRNTTLPSQGATKSSPTDRPFGKYKYLCEICKRVFADKRYLNDHMRKHEGIMYKCEYCPKSFSSYRSMQLHLPLHTGKYPLHCGQCGAGFNLRRELEAHENQHQGKGFTCLNCNKILYSEKDFSKHQQKCYPK